MDTQALFKEALEINLINKKIKHIDIMRASIILALVGLVSNVTEAVSVTGCGMGDPVQLFDDEDCTSEDFTEVKGAFTICSRRWCKLDEPYTRAIVPEQKKLIVKFMDVETESVLETV